jgi:tRNA (guanosine-2'-O-)-methyltransferase
MPTKERIKKIEKVLSGRTADIRVVLEEVKNTHNASAVVRTCDAAGIQYLDIITSSGDPFPVNKAISTRAEKWLQFNYYSSPSECLNSLKQKGFTILATSLNEKAESYIDLDYTKPVAIIFGNEADGISPEACGLADHFIRIPMAGMAQSLNLSVSVGIILYEALRQRKACPSFRPAGLEQAEFDHFYKRWLKID